MTFNAALFYETLHVIADVESMAYLIVICGYIPAIYHACIIFILIVMNLFIWVLKSLLLSPNLACSAFCYHM